MRGRIIKQHAWFILLLQNKNTPSGYPWLSGQLSDSYLQVTVPLQLKYGLQWKQPCLYNISMPLSLAGWIRMGSLQNLDSLPRGLGL